MNKRWMGWIAGLTAPLMGCDTGTTTTPTTDEEPVSMEKSRKRET